MPALAQCRLFHSQRKLLALCIYPTILFGTVMIWRPLIGKESENKEEGYIYPLDNTGNIPRPVTSPKLKKDFLVLDSVENSGASAGLDQKTANSLKNAMTTTRDGKEAVIK